MRKRTRRPADPDRLIYWMATNQFDWMVRQQQGEPVEVPFEPDFRRITALTAGGEVCHMSKQEYYQRADNACLHDQPPAYTRRIRAMLLHLIRTGQPMPPPPRKPRRKKGTPRTPDPTLF